MTPLTTEASIRSVHGYVDFWKVGKFNHNKEIERSIYYLKFRDDAIVLLELYGCKYYI